MFKRTCFLAFWAVVIGVGIVATPAFSAPRSSPRSAPTSASIPATTLTVSAASSLTDVMPAIALAFEKRYPQIDVRFNFGGSSALVEQIRGGAPVDVLATASETTMWKAVTAKLVGRPLFFARNTMAIAMPRGNPAGVKSISDLSHVSVALCDVSVPCGAAASELLKLNEVTVTPVTRELDVRDVLGKVIADQVDAGIVYVTDVRAAGNKVTSISISPNVNVTTTYPIAAVTGSQHQAAAKAFVDYVRYTPSAQGILRAWGFARPWGS